MRKLFQIIAITQDFFYEGEIATITKLFQAGLKSLHVRKPVATKTELRTFLRQIPGEFLPRIVIHNHYSLVKEFNLKGIHLPERIRKRNLKIDQKIISTSFHSIDELNKNRKKYEYVFLSPIFESISKVGYKGSFDPEDLKPLLKKHKNVVALGGITNKNIFYTKKAGFYGAATIGYVWQNKNPASSYKKLVSKIE